MSTPADPRQRSTEELVRAARAGSSECFGVLVERYEGPLYRFLLVRTRGAADAEELAHRTLVRAWSHLERYDERWSFSTWLFTIARREAIADSRASQRRGPSGPVPDDLVDPGPGPSDHLSRDEQRAGLWDLAARVLTADQASALWLRYGEDLAPTQIAPILGRNPTAVRVLLHRARRALARHVDAPVAGALADVAPLPIRHPGGA